ncbi:MAG: hypothetical protein NEHIOOID_01361 [Holosporales bacterium]
MRIIEQFSDVADASCEKYKDTLEQSPIAVTVAAGAGAVAEAPKALDK